MNNYGFHFAESYQGYWNIAQIGRKIPGTLYIEKHSIRLELFWNNITRKNIRVISSVTGYAFAEQENKMSKENVQGKEKMSMGDGKNIQGKMSKDNVPELTDDELALPLEPYEYQSAKNKKNRRRQAIIGMIAKDSHISLKLMAVKLDVNIKTIWRDLDELKSCGVIERIGDDFTGEWKICKKK